MNDLIMELTDLKYLDWTEQKLAPGTPGCFLKAYEETQNGRIYYKLSNYDSYRGVFGHECVNELIVSRLMDCLEIPHLQYQLIHAEICINKKILQTWICSSENFRKGKEEKIGFDVLYDMTKEEDESPLDFAFRHGWKRTIYQMFLVDYLVANRDRHGSNLEILRDKNNVRLAPLFDQGVSLLFSTYGDEQQIETFDVMRDFPVNNYIGAKSLEYNLSLIPADFDLKILPLQEKEKEYILSGLETVLSDIHGEKIWQMIWQRWCNYEKIRNQTVNG